MVKIVVKGSAETRTDENAKYRPLRNLDGVSFDWDMTVDCELPVIQEKNIQNDETVFVYDGGELYTVTTYTADDKLTNKELDDLRDYTIEQWKTGLGKTVQENPVALVDNKSNSIKNVFMFMWHKNQVQFITQE